MTQELVSIITPTYNCSDFISQTIKSIQTQTYKNWELLITDDCSTDNTIEIIENYIQQDPRIRLFRLKSNSGAGVARNNSIKEAKGRYIAFCDGDDRWHPWKLEHQIEFMNKKKCALSYGCYDTCNENGTINGFVKCLPKINYLKIIQDNGIGCLTAIYDTQIIGKHFMPTIRKRQDWCLWIEIIKEAKIAYGMHESLGIYRVRSGSISSNKIAMLKYNFKVYNSFLGFNKVSSTLILLCYFMPHYLWKKYRQRHFNINHINNQ